MPASFLGELILKPVLEFLLEGVCYYLGRVVIYVTTLGRVACDHITRETPRRKLGWHGLFSRRAGRINLTTDATAGVGVLFLLVLLGIYFGPLRSKGDKQGTVAWG